MNIHTECIYCILLKELMHNRDRMPFYMYILPANPVNIVQDCKIKLSGEFGSGLY
jgi:hypothetical protein